MIAGRLTHRAQVLRNVAVGNDVWGQPLPPDFQPHGQPLPCFVYSQKTGEVIDGQKVAMVGDFRALFALGADITQDDELASITDRRGAAIVDGRLRVEGRPEPKHTHLEVTLKRIG